MARLPPRPRPLGACLALAALVLMTAFPSTTLAEILDSSITTDSRYIIPFHTFGFTPKGEIIVNISNLNFHHNKNTPDRGRMGFVLAATESRMTLQEDLNHQKCLLDDDNAYQLFKLDNFKDDSYSGQFQLKEAHEYTLFFINCQNDVLVSMDVRLDFFNVESDGRKNYLPAGKTLLPLIYFTFFIVYLAAGTLWIYFCYTQRANAHRIHFLMGILVFFKALTVLAQGGEYSYIEVTGVAHGWNIVFYIFTFFRGIMLFAVIVLIGTGWSFLKPYLQDKEKKIIMIVIPLQVFANVATIVLDETGPSDREWFTWSYIFRLVDIICCCAILFPIVWSIKHLKEASHTDGKAARNVVKLTLFRQFYVVVVTYIYFTRIVVFLLQSTTPYHYAWTADLASELATLAFYVFTGYKFRPVDNNPYFVIDEEEEAAAVQALKDDDFDL